tara:strand:- start:181 stop:543 length:363 start_codon:yes stop_codon:yes gene_type:complete
MYTTLLMVAALSPSPAQDRYDLMPLPQSEEVSYDLMVPIKPKTIVEPKTRVLARYDQLTDDVPLPKAPVDPNRSKSPEAARETASERFSSGRRLFRGRLFRGRFKGRIRGLFGNLLRGCN